MKSFFQRLYSKVKADPSWSFFLAFAFLSAVSLPLARAAMALSFVFTLASPGRRRSLRITSPTSITPSPFTSATNSLKLFSCSFRI